MSRADFLLRVFSRTQISPFPELFEDDLTAFFEDNITRLCPLQVLVCVWLKHSFFHKDRFVEFSSSLILLISRLQI